MIIILLIISPLFHTKRTLFPFHKHLKFRSYKICLKYEYHTSFTETQNLNEEALYILILFDKSSLYNFSLIQTRYKTDQSLTGNK